MTLNGLKKGIYDELYVTDGSTLTRIDGTNSLEADVTELQAQDVNLQAQITSNDVSMSSNFATLGADVVALTSSKQDAITKGAHAGAVQLLDSNNTLRPIWASGDAYILDQGNRVMFSVNSDSTKQDVISVTSPLAMTANTVSIDLSGKQDVLSATAPIQLQNNTIGIDLGNLGDFTAGNITCSGIFGAVQTQLSSEFATKAENAA